MIILKYIIYFIMIMSAACRNGNRDTLAGLLLENEYYPRTWFSYPGRFTEFSQKVQVKKRILEIVDSASSSLVFYAYSLNDSDIIDAIIRAKERGVGVVIHGDTDSDYQPLIDAGVPILIWQKSGIHHVKVIIADRRVFTGTGNFTMNGLLSDHNGYFEFLLPESKVSDFHHFMEESYAAPVLVTNELQFLSSPGDGMHIQNLLLAEISRAQESIDYLIFNHYDQIITHELRKASLRGVKIRGIYNQPVNPEGEYLAEYFYGIGATVYKEGNEDVSSAGGRQGGGLVHHKTMIIDHKLVLTGSYNYSSSARDANREILTRTGFPAVVAAFEKEFSRVLFHSQAMYPEVFNFTEERTDTTLVSVNLLCLAVPFRKGVLETGRGIFKTAIYYGNWRINDCQNPDSITLATLFSDSREEAILNGFELYERNSLRRISTAVNRNHLFQKDKKIEMIVAGSVNRAFPGKIEIKLPGSGFNHQKIYLWTPGQSVLESVLYQTGDPQTYLADFTLNPLQMKRGILLIEDDAGLSAFCYDSGNVNPAITGFFREAAVRKTIASGEETLPIKCNN